MKFRFFFLGLFTALFVIISSCSKDGDPMDAKGGCENDNWNQQMQSEATNWTGALSNYASDPTPANCDKYKQAGKKYIDALQNLRKCVPNTNIKEYDNSLANAKKELEEIDCSE